MINGVLADKFHRKTVFAASVIVGELACAAFFVPMTSKQTSGMVFG